MGCLPRLQLVSVEVPSSVARCRIRLPGPRAVTRYVRRLIGNKDREHFVAVHLNAKQQVLSAEVVSVGTLTATLVHPREVFKAAILMNAHGLVCAHNHPSQDITPSAEDLALRARLSQAGKILGIELVDFLVVTKSRFWSWRETHPDEVTSALEGF